MYIEINNSSIEIVLKLHSFPVSIFRRQNSSAVSSSIGSAEKKPPQLQYVFQFGRQSSVNNRIRLFFYAIGLFYTRLC